MNEERQGYAMIQEGGYPEKPAPGVPRREAEVGTTATPRSSRASRVVAAVMMNVVRMVLVRLVASSVCDAQHG